MNDYQLLHPQSQVTQASSSSVLSRNQSKPRVDQDHQKQNKDKKDKKDDLDTARSTEKDGKDRRNKAGKGKGADNQNADVKKTIKKIYKTSSTSQQPTDSRQAKGSK